MTGREIVKEIGTNRKSDQTFIKWCRKENDFADYELVDRFLASAGTSDEYAGYELLTMEQMWEVLKNMDPKGVSRGEKEGAEVISGTRSGPMAPQRAGYAPLHPTRSSPSLT